MMTCPLAAMFTEINPYPFNDRAPRNIAPQHSHGVTMFSYVLSAFLERLVTNMSSIHLPRLPVRTVIAIWTGVGFVGGAIALLAVLSIAASHGFLPAQLAFGYTGVGREFMEFIAG